MPTAYEIAQGAQAEFTAGYLEAVQTATPLFAAFDARTSTSTNFLSMALVSLPSASFVNLGEGFTSSAAQFDLREFNCSLIGGIVKAEKISADRWDHAHPHMGYGYFDIQAQSTLQSSLLHVERQLVQGWTNDSKGFPGLKQTTPFASGNVLTLTDSPEDTDFRKTVINAGGSTANTATSVYSVTFGELNAQLVIGGVGADGEFLSMSEIRTQMMAPNPNETSKLNEHYVAQMQGWVGLSIGGFNQSVGGQDVPPQYCVRRLANVTPDTDKDLDDYKMEALRQSHPSGYAPSIYVMSGRSGRALAKSRGATNVFVSLPGSGSHNGSFSKVPPPPDNYEGTPIIYTTAVTNSQAIEV